MQTNNNVIDNNCFDKFNKYRIINEPRFKNSYEPDEVERLPKQRTHRQAVIDAGIRAGIFDLYQNEQDPNISKHYKIIASQLIRAYYEAGNIVRIDEVSLDCYNPEILPNGINKLVFSVNKTPEFIEYYKSNIYCDKKPFYSMYNFNFNIILLRNIEFYTNTRILNGNAKSDAELNSYRDSSINGYGFNGYVYNGNIPIPYFADLQGYNYDVIKFLCIRPFQKIVLKGVFEYGEKLTMKDGILEEKCVSYTAKNIDDKFDFITDLNISDYENLLSLAVPMIKSSLNQQLTDTDIKISEDAKARLNKTTKQAKKYF